VRIFVGQTRGAALTRRLWLLGIGECTARGELPPRRRPWFYDNGAYGDWTAGRPFDSEQFLADMDGIYRCIDRPEFIVLPDLVAQGRASLEESRRWIHRCHGLAPLYLAVQDGMEPADLDERLVGELAGLFVGGTLKWKVRHGRSWVQAAHALGLRCHIGRVGVPKRIRWAMRIAADSIDSSLPLWSEGNLDRFLRAMDPPVQRSLFAEAA
jgi:hypothetical protein